MSSSCGIKTINTFIHSRSFLENHVHPIPDQNKQSLCPFLDWPHTQAFLGVRHAFLPQAGTRDEPVRTSAWEAIFRPKRRKNRINLGFWETAHLPLPYANINTYFSFRAKCCLRGGVGGQFLRNRSLSNLMGSCQKPKFIPKSLPLGRHILICLTYRVRTHLESPSMLK